MASVLINDRFSSDFIALIYLHACIDVQSNFGMEKIVLN